MSTRRKKRRASRYKVHFAFDNCGTLSCRCCCMYATLFLARYRSYRDASQVESKTNAAYTLMCESRSIDRNSIYKENRSDARINHNPSYCGSQQNKKVRKLRRIKMKTLLILQRISFAAFCWLYEQHTFFRLKHYLTFKIYRNQNFPFFRIG